MSDFKLDPNSNDPIIRFITSLRGKRLVLFFLFLTGLTLLSFLLTIVDGTFINSSMHADLVHDYGDISLYLFGFPVTVLVIAWYSQKLSPALETLKENGIVVISDDEWRKFIRIANKIFSNKIFPLIPYLIASFITIYLVRIYISPGPVTYWYFSPKQSQNILGGNFYDSCIFLNIFFTFICYPINNQNLHCPKRAF